jgi:hypothetical protein
MKNETNVFVMSRVKSTFKKVICNRKFETLNALMYYCIFLSPDGGIGRRARLKILYSQGCAGSIPVLGTKTFGLNPDTTKVSGFFS